MKGTIPFLLILLIISTPCYSIKLEDIKKIDSVTSATITTPNKVSDKPTPASISGKITLKEKLGLLLLRKQFGSEPLTEAEIKKANSNASLGLMFGILSILIFPLFAIPGLILSNKAFMTENFKPNTLTKGNLNAAKAGRITSWIGIGLLALTLALVLIVLAVGRFN